MTSKRIRNEIEMKPKRNRIAFFFSDLLFNFNWFYRYVGLIDPGVWSNPRSAHEDQEVWTWRA